MARTAKRLKSAGRRHRKAQLAGRHGARCTYCHHPFATLADATLDHIAPYYLWRTWTVTALTLACLDCNHRKANRLPLSLALLLLESVGSSRPTPNPTESARREHSSIRREHPTADDGSAVFTAPFTAPLTLAAWRLLARLAHTHQSTSHQDVRREQSGVHTAVQQRRSDHTTGEAEAA